MKKMTLEDAIPALIRKAKKGDRTSFDELIQVYQNRLESLIRSRMGKHLQEIIESEDVKQETLVRAFQNIKKFRWQGKESFLRWLGGIAENVILNTAKKYPRTRKLRLQRNISSPEESPSKVLRRDERFQRLETSLKELSEDHRTVILLARIDGLPIREIARKMQKSESAVKNLLLRALKSLKLSFGHTDSLGLPDRSLEGGRKGEDA